MSYPGFPRSVGLVFIDRPASRKPRFGFRWKKKGQLNFDSDACTYFLLQMNSIQGTFDYQVMDLEFDTVPPIEKDQVMPKEDILNWFDNEVKKFEETEETGKYKMDYWIGITSKNVNKDWFSMIHHKDQTNSGKHIGIITTDTWEKEYSPPSLFEYLSITVFTQSMSALNNDFMGKFHTHGFLKTKGCIFDWTVWKPYKRILVSNPNLCSICRMRLSDLNEIIKQNTKYFGLVDDVNRFFSRKWMGSLDIIDSPIFNLNKLYRYNTDRNSGFSKKPWEKFRDSVIDHSAEWIVGTIGAGVVGGILLSVISIGLFGHRGN